MKGSSRLAEKRWRAEDAAQVLEDLQRSGLSLNAFAKGRGLCAQRLRWWRGRLALGEVRAGTVAPAVRLVELVPPAASVVAPMAPLWVQVHCPTGHTIELLDLDAARGLSLVLRALGELPC